MSVNFFRQLVQKPWVTVPATPDNLVEGGGMVGVISIGDVVKARISEVEWENTALTDMIIGH